MSPDAIKRLDHEIIVRIVEPHAKVLDLGCGNGDLLAALIREKQADAEGVEMDEAGIMACVEKGVRVFHSDIESWMADYPKGSFDYVILNQSMQEIRNVDAVLTQALHIGKKVIVGFSNFAHFSARLSILLRGRVPVTNALPHTWYDTPNIHFLSVLDFKEYCREKKLRVDGAYFIGNDKEIGLFANLRAQQAVFVISQR